MRLSDISISAIARLVQMAILTGTDVVDNLRLMRLRQEGELLEPDEEFLKGFEESIQKMLETANDLGSR